VTPGQVPELIGKGKGRHEVVNGQKLGLLAIQPKRGFMILALGAAAVPTGAGSLDCMTAVRALDEQMAGLRCPARPGGLDGAQVSLREPGGLFGLKSIVILIQNGGKLHDHTLLRST
jgi:hypothetical protein